MSDVHVLPFLQSTSIQFTIKRVQRMLRNFCMKSGIQEKKLASTCFEANKAIFRDAWCSRTEGQMADEIATPSLYTAFTVEKRWSKQRQWDKINLSCIISIRRNATDEWCTWPSQTHKHWRSKKFVHQFNKSTPLVYLSVTRTRTSTTLSYRLCQG